MHCSQPVYLRTTLSHIFATMITVVPIGKMSSEAKILMMIIYIPLELQAFAYRMRIKWLGNSGEASTADKSHHKMAVRRGILGLKNVEARCSNSFRWEKEQLSVETSWANGRSFPSAPTLWASQQDARHITHSLMPMGGGCTLLWTN